MTRRWRGRAATLVVLLGTALGFAIATPRFHFTTKITDFLPDDDANRGAQIAALLAESELAKVMVIDVTLGDKAPTAELHDLALSLVTYLRAQPDVGVARSGFTETDVTAMLAFLKAWPPTTFLPRTAYTDQALRTRLTELRDQLGSPMGVMFRQTAPRDPLGGMWGAAQRAARLAGHGDRR